MEYHYKDKYDSEFSLIDVSETEFDIKSISQSCYKIIWAKEKDVTLNVDGYLVSLKKDQLLFVSPLNKLDLKIAYKKVVIYSFNREFYCIRDHDAEVSCNGFLFLGSAQPIVVDLTEKEKKSFMLLYDFFVEEFEEMDHIQGEMLLVLLKRLLIKSVRIARKLLPEKDMPKSKLEIIRKFNILVETHFREKHKVLKYANLLNLSPKSLSNVFLRYYNKPPLKIISERICLEGERLIRYSDKSVSEIAYMLGFSETSHFSKFLKKHTGHSPSEYKAIGQIE